MFVYVRLGNVSPSSVLSKRAALSVQEQL